MRFANTILGQHLNGIDEQEYDLTVPANKREVLKRIEEVVEETGK